MYSKILSKKERENEGEKEMSVSANRSHPYAKVKSRLGLPDLLNKS